MINNFFSKAATDTFSSETLLENKNVKVERVFAPEEALKPSFFGPQKDNNFLLLLKGKLSLKYQNGKERVSLNPGGYIVTTPTTKERDRVASISQDKETVWLSVHFPGEIKEGLFPSPDLLILKKVKDDMKRNIFFRGRIDSWVETKNLRVERVVAHGQASLDVASCETPVNQFVLLLEGEARLEVETEKVNLMPGTGRLLENVKVNLTPGDHILIPQHTRHRVDWTSPDRETVWLTVYFGGNIGEGKYQ
jgi:cupin 2 domain-containing protein